MISLLQILSEIKIMGSIDPEKIIELIDKITKDFNFFFNKDDEDIIRKYYMNSIKQIKINYNLNSLRDINTIRNMSKNQLLSLYKDLLNFIQKYSKNLDEIKIHGNINAQKVIDLMDSLYNQDIPIKYELDTILKNYNVFKRWRDWIRESIKKLSQKQLVNLYQDLIKLKQDKNIL